MAGIMRKNQNTPLLLLLCILLVFITLTAKSAYVVNAEAGFDGMIRPQRWNPVRFYCENQGTETFEGEIIIKSSDFRQSNIYRSPISLPSPSRKIITIPMMTATYPDSSIQWELRRKGRVIESGAITVKPMNTQDTPLLVISSRTQGINLLNGMKNTHGSEIRLITVGGSALESLPDQSMMYEPVEAVLWGDIRPEALRPAQIQALQEWVRSGGKLIVWGGASGDQLRGSWLESLLPVELRNQAVLTRPSLTIGHFTAPLNIGEGWVITPAKARKAPEVAAFVFQSLPETDLSISGAYGLGWVTYLAFDPTSPQFSTWQSAGDFLRFLLSVTRIETPHPSLIWRQMQESSWDPVGRGRTSGLREILQRSQLLRPPSLRFVILFLFAYILIVGPVNYLFLRHKKRLELTWLTIPIIVLAFLTIEYAIGRSSKGSKIVVDSFEVLLGKSGQSVFQHQSLFGIFSPSKRDYEIDWNLPEGRVLPSLEHSWQSENKETVFLVRDRVQIARHPMNMWTMDLFSAEGIRDIGGVISCNLLSTSEGFRGTFDNQSALNLEKTCLYWMGRYFDLPEVRAGEKIEITSSFLNYESGRTSPPAYMIEQEDLTKPRYSKVMVDVIEKNMLQQMSGQPIVLAWVQQPPEILRLGNNPFEYQSRTLLCLGASIQIMGSRIKIPFGQHQVWWNLERGELVPQYDKNLFSLQEGIVVVTLVPPVPLPPLRSVDALDLRFQLTNPSSIPIALDIYDWQNARWHKNVHQVGSLASSVQVIQLAGKPEVMNWINPDNQSLCIRLTIGSGKSTVQEEQKMDLSLPEIMGSTEIQDLMMPDMPMPGMGAMSYIPPHQAFRVSAIDIQLEGTPE